MQTNYTPSTVSETVWWRIISQRRLSQREIRYEGGREKEREREGDQKVSQTVTVLRDVPEYQLTLCLCLCVITGRVKAHAKLALRCLVTLLSIMFGERLFTCSHWTVTLRNMQWRVPVKTQVLAVWDQAQCVRECVCGVVFNIYSVWGQIEFMIHK